MLNATLYVDKVYSYQNCVKTGKRGKYRTSNYNKFSYQINEQLLDYDCDIEDGPLKVDITIYFKLPKNTTKKNIVILDGELSTKHIDLDNIAKLVNDVVFDFYGAEDANIVDLHISKRWRYCEGDDYLDKIDYKIEKA